MKIIAISTPKVTDDDASIIKQILERGINIIHLRKPESDINECRKLLEKLNQNASKYNFQVKSAQNGIYMMPIVNGKAIEEDEFNKLDETIKQEYEEKSVLVQEEIMNVIGQIKEIERQSDKKISEYAKNDLFIFNGLDKDRDYAVKMINENENLKISCTKLTL